MSFYLRLCLRWFYAFIFFAYISPAQAQSADFCTDFMDSYISAEENAKALMRPVAVENNCDIPDVSGSEPSKELVEMRDALQRARIQRENAETAQQKAEEQAKATAVALEGALMRTSMLEDELTKLRASVPEQLVAGRELSAPECVSNETVSPDPEPGTSCANLEGALREMDADMDATRDRIATLEKQLTESEDREAGLQDRIGELEADAGNLPIIEEILGARLEQSFAQLQRQPCNPPMFRLETGESLTAVLSGAVVSDADKETLINGLSLPGSVRLDDRISITPRAARCRVALAEIYETETGEDGNLVLSSRADAVVDEVFGGLVQSDRCADLGAALDANPAVQALRDSVIEGYFGIWVRNTRLDLLHACIRGIDGSYSLDRDPARNARHLIAFERPGPMVHANTQDAPPERETDEDVSTEPVPPRAALPEEPAGEPPAARELPSVAALSAWLEGLEDRADKPPVDWVLGSQGLFVGPNAIYFRPAVMHEGDENWYVVKPSVHRAGSDPQQFKLRQVIGENLSSLRDATPEVDFRFFIHVEPVGNDEPDEASLHVAPYNLRAIMKQQQQQELGDPEQWPLSCYSVVFFPQASPRRRNEHRFYEPAACSDQERAAVRDGIEVRGSGGYWTSFPHDRKDFPVLVLTRPTGQTSSETGAAQ